jgi:prepilin-type N-terminal cleavage/methylation domain-containing protein
MLRQRLRAARANDEGFTLIELLIVVVVIGLLASITVFGVDAFKKDGDKAACTSNKKNLEIAAQAYYAKNNYKYPASKDDLVPAYLKAEPAGSIVYSASAEPVLTCPA